MTGGQLMEEMRAHPNTQAVIDAWRRLSDGDLADDGPTTDDYPGVVGRLFVLNHVADSDYSFRQLTEHNFLSIWNEPDRQLVSAALSSATPQRGPVLIRARGETLAGKRVELEFALAPLPGRNGSPTRYLGVCQAMTPEELLAGRPLRRLQALAVYPPPTEQTPAIRLVSSR
jgi:hypothetical protein